MEGTHTWIGTDHYHSTNSSLDTIYNISLRRAITILANNQLVLSDPDAMFNNTTADTFLYRSDAGGIATFTHIYIDYYFTNTQYDTIRYSYGSNIILWDYHYTTPSAFGDGHLQAR